MERGYIAQVLKFTIAFLSQRGLLDGVKKAISPATARLIDKPPMLPFTFVDHQPFDEIFDAMIKLPDGAELCADLGEITAHNLAGSILAPVLQMAFTLFGTTPASIFANLDRFFSVAARGVSFSYAAEGERSGVVTAVAQGPAALFDITRGNLREVFRLCKVNGEISRPELVPEGARYRVQW